VSWRTQHPQAGCRSRPYPQQILYRAAIKSRGDLGRKRYFRGVDQVGKGETSAVVLDRASIEEAAIANDRVGLQIGINICSGISSRAASAHLRPGNERTAGVGHRIIFLIARRRLRGSKKGSLARPGSVDQDAFPMRDLERYLALWVCAV
jgi:hypothetical protein